AVEFGGQLRKSPFHNSKKMAKPRKPKNEEQKPDNNNNSIAVIQHQKLCLSIDMENQRIYGYTELKVIVPESGLVGLHADNMIIESVLVDGEKTEFHFIPHFQLIDDERRFSSVSSTHSAADAASSSYVSSLEMELVPNLLILCSKEVKSVDNEQQKFESVDSEQQKVEENATEKNVQNGSQTIAENGVHINGENGSQTNQENGSQLSGEVKQNVKLIRIDYWIEKAETGIHFDRNVLHTDNQIRRAQCWFPCMNNSSQRYCFDMEFTVAQNFVAVSNGTLLYQVLSKDDPPRKTFVYSLSVPVAARWISLVVAQFEILVDSHNGIISHMCLSPDILKLRNTATFFHSAFSHYEDYLSAPFPFGSYKQVFIAPEMTISSLSIGASMSIFSSQVLFDEKTISTRIKLAYALARQWFGVYISADSPSDEWLLDGLADFLTDSFIKRFLGNNEARYRRYKENSAVCKADVSGASTLSCSAATDLYGTQCLGLSGKIRSWKSVAVLQMLEKQMGPESFRKILQVIILRAQDKTRSLRTLSTKEFRHFSNKVGNLERPFLKEFFPRWVGSCGCPVLRMGLSYNKRKNIIELAVFRGCTAAQNAVSVEHSNNHDSETREGDVGWPGMMSIRVYELDGMYDHPILPMSGEALQLLEIQCHSRLAAKRIQKPKKGSKLDGSDDNGETPTADLRTNVLFFGQCGITLALAEGRSPNGISCQNSFQSTHSDVAKTRHILQINQLEKDRDVVAQAQAIATLEALPQLSFSVVNALYNFLSDSKAFWRVRIEAAFALANTASEDTDWAGLLHLVKFYKSRRFDETMGLPRPNDFHDFPEYFVLEAIPHAIAMVRAADKKSPREAVEFLLQLLKYNDNNGNPYSDVYWLAALVQSIGELEFGQQNKLLSSLLKRIDRLLQFERLMPSYNGILTISCIRSLTQTALKLSASIPLDRVSELIKPFRDFGTLWKVRIEASRALLDLEFQCNGIDAALILFTRYLEEEASLRGQVKLSLHAMRLCQIKGEDVIKASTLALLLRLLEGRKAFNNVLLRHHLFCLFQILSGRPSTLYGIPRTQVQPSGEPKTCSEQIKTAFLKLKISRPSEPLGDAQNLLPDALPIPEDSKEAIPIPEASKEADTVSNGSERKRAVLKIKVKQSAASSRAEEAEKVVVNISDGVQDEAERGGSSSMSVDAPVRVTSEPLNADCQIIEEVNSCHDRDSRITASIGSVKPVNNLDENRNELQCTADSSTVDCQPQPEDRSLPNIIKGNGVGPETQKYSSLQTLSVGRNDHGAQSLGLEDQDFCKKEKKDKKKTKDKDKKRKRDKEDHKGHRDDPEYLERKRLKKEKKRKEKEIMKLQSGNVKLSSTALQSTSFEPGGEFALQTRDLRASFVGLCTNEEPRVKPAPVELKPNEPGNSEVVSKPLETKGDGLEGSSSVRKIRLKIKDRNLNKL
ncbi:hypothetical protein IFM89_000860, partial [Coptis chinensis]